jgi:membrane protein implicated in regulation of membrane protease activity
VSFAWIAGLALIAALVLVPGVASIATIGTVALFAAGIPAAILLSATGGARLPEASSAVLGVVLVAGWLAGVTYGVARRRRGRPTDHGPRGPVS